LVFELTTAWRREESSLLKQGFKYLISFLRGGFFFCPMCFNWSEDLVVRNAASGPHRCAVLSFSLPICSISYNSYTVIARKCHYISPETNAAKSNGITQPEVKRHCSTANLYAAIPRLSPVHPGCDNQSHIVSKILFPSLRNNTFF
jgi:hypothetical protein